MVIEITLHLIVLLPRFLVSVAKLLQRFDLITCAHIDIHLNFAFDIVTTYMIDLKEDF